MIGGKLYFQTLDDKGECVGIYKDGELFFQETPQDLTRTWKYAEYLEDSDVEFASIYSGNSSLSDCCPSYLIDEWTDVEERLKAFYRSFVIAKVDLNQNCFFDLVPKKFLIRYCEIRNRITKYVFENWPKPDNYDFMVDLTKVLTRIRYQKMNIDLSALSAQAHLPKFRQAIKKYSQVRPYCHYNIRGTKTGRLTTLSDSFPIMTLDKDLRAMVKPTQDWFVELDFNAAELRTLMTLAGSKAPLEDLHTWNATNLFPPGTDRTEAKQRLFSWLYDEAKTNPTLARYYNRDRVRAKYWDGEKVTTHFGREIEVDEKRALNYIIQSTTADLVLRQLIKVYNFLKDKKSFVSFTIHDNIVLDIPNEERYIIPEVIEIFSNTDLGKFLVNVKAGKDFGNLKELNL